MSDQLPGRVDVAALVPEQFESDGDGCPDSLDFITDMYGTYACPAQVDYCDGRT